MKKIYSFIVLLLSAAALLTGCKEDSPFTTAGPDDMPIFLSPSSMQYGLTDAITVNRDEVAAYSVIVTPVDYTRIQWIENREVLCEGASLSHQFLAGQYDIRIEATTAAGKMAYRNLTVNVKSLEGDPALQDNAQQRWLVKGETCTCQGANLADAAEITLKRQIAMDEDEAEDPATGAVVTLPCTATADAITFDVPAELAEGTYRATLTTVGGEQFGLGLVTVNAEKWKPEDVKEIVLWEGNNALNWDAENIKVTADLLAEVPVGTEITIAYTKIPAEELAEVYWALRITSPVWDGDQDILPQTSFDDNEETSLTIVYDERVKGIIERQGAMCLVGNGLKVTKISYMGAAGSSALVLWEGNNALNWDAENIKVTAEDLAEVEEGQAITIEYQKIPAEELAEVYWALRITSPVWDGDQDILPQTSFDNDEETSYSFCYDGRVKGIIERQGAMCLVGNGLRITRITAE